MSSVVVTGANGFLGQYIVRRFAAQNWNVVGVDRSPPRTEVLQATARFYRWSLPDARWRVLLRDMKPDLCVHCAGSASVPISFAEPARDFVAGPQLVFELLDSLRQESPRTRFLFLSSAAVFGRPDRLPVHEDDPAAPISPYGVHKWLAEQLCREFTAFFGLTTASVRIFSAYGRGLRRQVVWDVCDKLLHAPVVTLQGSGNETRDFIHAEDVAQAIECIALRGELKGECYNVASGQETRIGELARQVTELLHVERKITFSGVLPEGTPASWRADVSRLETLGFRQQVSLREGLRDFITWVRDETAPQRIPYSA